MEETVSWKRKNVILSLPKRSLELVRQYVGLVRDASTMSDECILQRVQKAAAAAADEDGAAEYRCLETGGFLFPTVAVHPFYRERNLPHDGSGRFAALELGCGFGPDGRQMISDGIAATVLGVDRNELYLRLGCELFGDDPAQAIMVWNRDFGQGGGVDRTNNNHSGSRALPCVAFLALDLADQNQSDDTIVAAIQNILQRQQQVARGISSKPEIGVVYAGKYLHCLGTESKLRIVFRRVWQLLSTGGLFFGVYGRNYKPVFECSSKENFTRVLTAEGFAVAMILEESAGATWFAAHKGPLSDAA